MASLAGEMAGTGKVAKPPISTHPAFPFIVALWFAALLGIGSLMVPVPVIEQLVSATGISALVPQMAPPLGFTARALIALAGTVGGGLIGLLIARKAAQAHRAQAPARFSRTVAASGVAGRKPISAREELGEIGLDGNAPRGRRALAIEEESGPSEVFELAPLPGGPLARHHLDHGALDLAEDEALELDDDAIVLADEAVAREPVSPGFSLLDDVDEVPRDPRTFGRARQEFQIPAAMAAPAIEAEMPEAEAAPDAPVDLHFSPPSLARSPLGEDAVVGDAAEDMAPAVPEDLPLADLVWSPQETFAPQDPHPMEHAAMHANRPDPEPAAPQADLRADWEEAAPEDLGLVQLAQRLGSSIEKRRERRAAMAAAAAAAASPAPQAPVAPASQPASPLAGDFDMAEAEEAAQAMAAYFNAPRDAAPAEPVAEAPVAAAQPPHAPAPAAPAAPAGARQVFQPVVTAPAPTAEDYFPGLARIDIGEEDADEDDLGDLAASFSLPLGSLSAAPAASPAAPPAASHVEARLSFAPPAAAGTPSPVADEEESWDEPEGETDFGSLLALNNPFQQRGETFVRIENEPQPEDGEIEPAVVFPGQGPAGGLRQTFGSPAVAEAPAPQAAAQPADPEENARALREALLNLQRMSGAA